MFSHDFPRQLRSDKQTIKSMKDIKKKIEKKVAHGMDSSDPANRPNHTRKNTICIEAFINSTPECSMGDLYKKIHDLDFGRVKKGSL